MGDILLRTLIADICFWTVVADLCFWMPEAYLLDFILDTRPIFDFGHKWLFFLFWTLVTVFLF